jgi:hypothetical protein
MRTDAHRTAALLAAALQLVKLAPAPPPGPDRRRVRQLVDVGLQRLAGAGSSARSRSCSMPANCTW